MRIFVRRSGGRHRWARGYCCCSSGYVTDEIIAEYIANQNTDMDEDFKVDGCGRLLEAAVRGKHFAGLGPEQGFQPATGSPRLEAMKHLLSRTHCLA